MEFNHLHLSRKGVEALLSSVEAEIMKALWERGPLRVKEIHSLLKPRNRVALTSIAVFLDRLHKRKFVERKVETGRGGTHYIYSAKTSRSGFEETVIEKTVNKLIESFGPTAVNYFNERFKS